MIDVPPLSTLIYNDDLGQLLQHKQALTNVSDHVNLLNIAVKFNSTNSMRILLQCNRYSPSAILRTLIHPSAPFSSQIYILAHNIGILEQIPPLSQLCLLSYVVFNKDYNLLQLLLISGINVRIINNTSSLELALTHDNETAAMMLLAAGANISPMFAADSNISPMLVRPFNSDMTELLNAVRTSSNYKGVPITDMLVNTRNNYFEPTRRQLAEATTAAYGFKSFPSDSRLSLLPHDIWEYYICPYLNLSRPTFNPSLS